MAKEDIKNTVATAVSGICAGDNTPDVVADSSAQAIAQVRFIAIVSGCARGTCARGYYTRSIVGALGALLSVDWQARAAQAEGRRCMKLCYEGTHYVSVAPASR